jgi:tetratricopeptide (TPR) repeat protein
VSKHQKDKRAKVEPATRQAQEGSNGGVTDLYRRGREAQEQAKYGEAQQLFEGALEAYGKLGDQAGSAEQAAFAASLYQVASLAAAQGKGDVARQRYEQSAQVFEELANNAEARGENDRAEQLHDQSRAARQLARSRSDTTEKGEIIGAAVELATSLVSRWLSRKSKGRGSTLNSAVRTSISNGDRVSQSILTAQQLTAEFRSNPASANLKYSERILEVQGRVATIGPGGFGLDAEANQNIRSRQTVGSWNLICSVPSLADLAEIQIGQIVTVKGRYKYSELVNPRLDKCRILSASKAPSQPPRQLLR